MGTAFLALGQALVDTVAVRLVGNDEDATIGPYRGPDEEENTEQKR